MPEKEGGKYKNERYSIAYSEKIKKSVKIKELSTTIKHLKDPLQILGAIVSSTSNANLNSDCIRTLEKTTINHPYRKGHSFHWNQVLSAISEAIAVLTAFEPHFDNISDTLYNLLKKKILVGKYQRSLEEALSNTGTNQLLPALSFDSSPAMIDKVYESIHGGQSGDICIQSQYRDANSEKITSIKLMKIYFTRSANAITKEVNEEPHQRNYNNFRQSEKKEAIFHLVDSKKKTLLMMLKPSFVSNPLCNASDEY